MLCVYLFFLSLSSFIPRPGGCNAVKIDPSIIGQLWTGLAATTSAASSGPSAVEVEYSLAGQGHHRTLKVTLRRGVEDGSRNEAALVIVINVTSNIYIDLDQISQMAKFGGLNVISSGHIDTEGSAMDSHPHIVLVYVTMQDKWVEVEVPLHLRYLAASSSPYSAITIPSPRLLLQSTKSGTSLPCSPALASSLCYWHPSPLTPSHLSHPPVAMVAVGQSSHVTVVAIVTVALTFSGILYLTYIIYHSETN